jgi:restriction system protein
MSKGLKPVSNRRDDAMSRVKWDRLEVLLADYYRAQGYEVDHCGTGGSRNNFDGGVDLRLSKGDERLLVQCKHWNAYKVAHNDVHQLLGVVVNEEATGGILATSGEFTKAAIEAASRQARIRLIDGDELRAMLGPLPGEEVEELDMRLSAPVTVGARRIAAHAAERAGVAAEERVRYGGAPRRVTTGAASDALVLLALKLLFIGIIVMLFIGAITKVSENLGKRITPRTQPRSMPTVNPLPAPQHDAGVLDAPTLTQSEDRTARGAAQVDSVESEAQARERRRRRAETMRVLEAYTPELLVAPPSTHRERWQAEGVGTDATK